jgi:hypothetical protein
MHKNKHKFLQMKQLKNPFINDHIAIKTVWCGAINPDNTTARTVLISKCFLLYRNGICLSKNFQMKVNILEIPFLIAICLFQRALNNNKNLIKINNHENISNNFLK